MECKALGKNRRAIPLVSGDEMASSSFKDTSSEATGSMRSPLSSFMRSPMSSSMTPSPVSSRLTMEFESAFLMEQEEPIRFLGTDILPYLSQPSSCSSSSEFDTQSSGGSGSTSFCDLNDSNRITLGSLIGLSMADSFRNFGDSLRFLTRGDSHYDTSGSSNRSADGPPRRSRSCSLLGDLFRCLQRSKPGYVETVPVGRNLTNLTSFTITEVSEEEERDLKSDSGPTVFENSVFVERDTLGSRIYEFNPLYATSEADPASRDMSLVRDSSASRDYEDAEESSPRLSVQVSSPTTLTAPVSPGGDFQQPLSPMRTVLTAICCRLGADDCSSD